MNNSPSEIDLLRAELAELRKEVAGMQSRTASPAHVDQIDKVVQDDHETNEAASNRRGFLRLAGAAAVGATAAAVISQASPAAAGTSVGPAVVDGDGLAVGVWNHSSGLNHTTGLYNSNASNLDDQTFRVDNYSNDFLSLPVNHRIAVAGITSGKDDSSAVSKRTGVYGRTRAPGTLGGQGVFGSAEGVDNDFATSFSFGVVGTAGTNGGYGVFGYNPTGAASVGVLGRADEGIGVIASSYTGISLYVRNSGRLLQDLRTTAGAPAIGTFTKGEMVRDLAGDMYICTVSGSPGTWLKVVAQNPALPAPTSLNLLAKPIRLLDSRGNGAPITNGGVKFSIGTSLTMQITGTAVDGISVPAGAKGILGNLTSTQAEQPGFGRVWAADQPTPATSNINFVTNVDVANYFISAVDATGQLKIEASQRTHMIIDVFGYIVS